MTLLIGLLCASAAYSQDAADQVTLKNGDTISGTVVGILNGVLTVVTPYSKEIKIDVAQIKGITTGKSAAVLLSDGALLKGKLVAGKEGEIMVQSDLAGPTTSIALAQVKAINPPENPPARYTGSIALGSSHSTGNTERTTVSLSADATRRTDDDRISARFLWNYAEESDRLTARNIFVGLKYDYFFSKYGYGYAGMELYSDEFRDLDLRTVGTIGAGWQALDEPDMSLFLEAGLAYINENFETAVDEDTLAARLAGKFTWTFWDGLVFSDHLTVYPKFEGGYLLRNEAGISTNLSAGWGLKFSNILDYNSDPPGTTKETDLLWLLSLTYTFS